MFKTKIFTTSPMESLNIRFLYEVHFYIILKHLLALLSFCTINRPVQNKTNDWRARFVWQHLSPNMRGRLANIGKHVIKLILRECSLGRLAKTKTLSRVWTSASYHIFLDVFGVTIILLADDRSGGFRITVLANIFPFEIKEAALVHSSFCEAWAILLLSFLNLIKTLKF